MTSGEPYACVPQSLRLVSRNQILNKNIRTFFIDVTDEYDLRFDVSMPETNPTNDSIS